MEFDVIQYISSNINLMYIITCNIITYFVLNYIERRNSERKLKKWIKRIIAFGVAFILGLVEVIILKHPVDPIFYGMFMQFLTWDYMFKPIVNSLIVKYESPHKLNDDVFNWYKAPFGVLFLFQSFTKFSLYSFILQQLTTT